ncbi:ATP-binding cassette domain-containing protein [Proteiniclasticum sp. C24MP]|uniref:ABC transporter ATP-binding protein n=1 Tax=Proteiniclasticum sp. C24MP TaxID=3374101 RepID=UPI003753F3BE
MEKIFTIEEPKFGGILEYPHMEISSGNTTFIQGASGAGKSTLLKLLNASLTPEEGRIFYQGKDIREMDTIELRKEVILIGQNVYLFDESIRENFRMYYEYRDLPAPDDETMKKYLRLCHADFRLEESCVSMSGGERQRIYIAICISFLPKVIMMDEPTSALDATTAGKVLDNLKKFCRENGITMIVVSHDEKLSEVYADEVLTITRRDN